MSETHDCPYPELDNQTFSVELTANEWAGIEQLLAGMLSTGCEIDIVISAHEKIGQASLKFIQDYFKNQGETP
jgi:hypothetical protein